MKLDAETVAVGALSAEQIALMRCLMDAHYEGVTEAQFEADLRAKHWVILLCHAGELCGFSTQRLFEHACEGRTVRILFSGDTIIDKRHWGSLALPVAWGRLMLSILAESPTELYWLLTTKGYKTYRFLPVFFREFYPGFESPTPAFEAALLRSVAGDCFGGRFDPVTGILRAGRGAQRLREGVAELEERRLADPHIAFFQNQNPGHAQGDELVCLARFHPDNLNAYIRRQLCI
jgi:hypothetical protein